MRAIHWSIGPLLSLASALLAIRIGSVVVGATKNQFSSHRNGEKEKKSISMESGMEGGQLQSDAGGGKGQGKYKARLRDLQAVVSGAVAPTLCKMMNAGRKGKAKEGFSCEYEKDVEVKQFV